MAVDYDNLNINYPTLLAKIPWLLDIQIVVFALPPVEHFEYPCVATLSPAPNGTNLTLGSAPSLLLSAIPAGQQYTIFRNSFMECRVHTTIQTDTFIPIVPIGAHVLEPCCVLWLLEPERTALQTSLEEGFSFVGEGWSVTDGNVKTFSPEELPPATKADPVGLYYVNGLSRKKLNVFGSESVDVWVSGVEPNKILRITQK